MPEYWNGVITATAVICGALNVLYTVASAAFCVIMEKAEKNKSKGPLIDVVRADKLEEYLLTADKKNEFIVCSETALSMDQIERIRQRWKADRGT